MTSQERRELHRRMDRAAKQFAREDWNAAKPYAMAGTVVLLLIGIAWSVWQAWR